VPFPQRLKKPGYRYLALILLIIAGVTSPRWGRALLHEFSFFHVQTIEIRGTRYLQPTDVVARLRVDTLQSVFDDVAPLETRLTSHPQVSSAKITRKPPGTLVVTITENLPVALVPSADGLQPYDSAGTPLPIDPSLTELDLPILSGFDKSTLHLLGTLRAQNPTIYARISQVQRERSGDVIFVLTPALRVRTDKGVAPDRFHDIFPVESDLARRNERPVELDLRYRDQVIARLP
jgi:cell division protein FtsQ